MSRARGRGCRPQVARERQTVVALLVGSRRRSIIVSDRAPGLTPALDLVVAAVGAEEEDRLGLAGLDVGDGARDRPGAACPRARASWTTSRPRAGRRSRPTPRSAAKMSSAPRARATAERPGAAGAPPAGAARGGSLTPGRPRWRAAAGPRRCEPLGQRGHEVAERLAVARSDAIETHSCGPWWPPPTGPNSTAGMPASRNETASEAPSRPTLSASPSIERPTASRRART